MGFDAGMIMSQLREAANMHLLRGETTLFGRKSLLTSVF